MNLCDTFSGSIAGEVKGIVFHFPGYCCWKDGASTWTMMEKGPSPYTESGVGLGLISFSFNKHETDTLHVG